MGARGADSSQCVLLGTNLVHDKGESSGGTSDPVCIVFSPQGSGSVVHVTIDVKPNPVRYRKDISSYLITVKVDLTTMS